MGRKKGRRSLMKSLKGERNLFIERPRVPGGPRTPVLSGIHRIGSLFPFFFLFLSLGGVLGRF